MSETKRFEAEWGGETLSIEVGKYAAQAGGACKVQYGDTVVLATATMSSYKRQGMNWFPLMVDYEEHHFAAGRIKGSRFMKRGGRPTDEAVLTSRLIDRALRPLFDQSMRYDVQIICSVLSYDGVNDPDIVALIGASCALHMSDIPWNGPLAGIRVGHKDGSYIVNPTHEEREGSILDLSFSGTSEKVIMVEAGANEAPDQVVLDGFSFGLDNMSAPLELIKQVQKEFGKEKRIVTAELTDEEKELDKERVRVEEMARPFILEKVKELFYGAPQASKGERSKQKEEIKKLTEAFLLEQSVEEDNVKFGTSVITEVLEAEVTRAIIEDDKRVDGRGIREVRNLVSEVQMLPRVHGSSHFMRGETQVLNIVTLGSPGDEQLLDGMEIVGTKKYFHHYNFTPFSVGEAKPLRGPSRRDIGHGGLAEKALLPMMPDKETFPYTIHSQSEIYGSNGSSSMGATCSSSLALMDAGVPIKEAVAGIAIGMASNEGGWKVITDIQDLEDGKGGMDFKICGSKNGYTALQMDTKTDGVTNDVIKEVFSHAKDALSTILGKMSEALSEARPELSEHAPRIVVVKINPELIGNVIGPGGKTINEIISTTGVQSIDIDDEGLVMITSTSSEGSKEAEEMVKQLTKEAKVGEIYKGKVVRIMDFGAIVEFLPKKDGMVHVSMMAPWRVEKVTDIVKLGDEVNVKIMEMEGGKTSLSMKDAPGNKYPEKPERTSSAPRSGSGSGGSSYGSRPRSSSPRPSSSRPSPSRKPEEKAEEKPEKKRHSFFKRKKDES
jgi:polyribonucleotide nucleotidyltransferase